MARTKKYLSSKTKSSSSSFYRPISRIARAGKKGINLQQNDLPINTNEENQLVEQLLEIKKLKSQLEEKLSLDHQSSSQNNSKTNFKPRTKIEDFSIQLFEDEESEEKPSGSKNQSFSSEEDLDNDIDFSSHDEKEELELLKKQIEYRQKLEQESKDRLEKIKADFENERKAMQRQLEILRKNTVRQEPITHNKFFSLSKELGEVVSQMEKLVNSSQFKASTSVPVSNIQPMESVSQIETNSIQASPSPEPIEIQKPNLSYLTSQTDKVIKPEPTIVLNADQSSPSSPNPTPTVVPEVKPKSNSRKKPPKIVMIMGTTFAIVLLLVGIAWFTVNRRTQVSQTLLQEYLPQDSGQNPAQQDLEKKIDQLIEESVTGNSNQDSDQVKGASDQQYEESQADVPFSQTYWDTVTDPNLKIELNYPKNAVNFIRTETSITFIRKNGYIFKVQLIESALELTEYWKMIKASSLNYKVKETTFRDLPALFLELEDFAQYPGDKYLVKNGNYIYDIWYATFSNTLSDDDTKRIDIMLNSFKFLD